MIDKDEFMSYLNVINYSTSQDQIDNSMRYLEKLHNNKILEDTINSILLESNTLSNIQLKQINHIVVKFNLLNKREEVKENLYSNIILFYDNKFLTENILVKVEELIKNEESKLSKRIVNKEYIQINKITDQFIIKDSLVSRLIERENINNLINYGGLKYQQYIDVLKDNNNKLEKEYESITLNNSTINNSLYNNKLAVTERLDEDDIIINSKFKELDLIIKGIKKKVNLRNDDLLLNKKRNI